MTIIDDLNKQFQSFMCKNYFYIFSFHKLFLICAIIFNIFTTTKVF